MVNTVAEEMAKMDAEAQPDLTAPELPGQEEPGFDWVAWMKSPTGEGPVESYLDHPMNLLGDKTGARILRGLSGLFGALNFALVDLIWGGFEFLRSRGQNGKS
jgi:hypothetical protein